MRDRIGTRALAAALAVALLLTGCTSSDEPESRPTGGTGQPGSGVGSTSGPLRVRLAAGGPIAAAPAPLAAVSGDELDRDRIAEILARLPDFATDDADRQDFNRPAASLRPPTVGETVDVAFVDPDDASGAPADPGPLAVLRHQPDGDVPVAPYLSVTFNQDIIPLGTLAQLDARDAPVRVTPELPGRWRWIGTRTLRYEHSHLDGSGVDALDRLPAATEYTVEIPAGTTSADGDVLAETFSWTFRTPTATVTSLVPTGSSLRLEPVFVATFDQRVDPAAVVATITLTADGKTQPVRVASAAEIDADDAARQAVTQALERRAVAFRAVAPLPADASIDIAIGPGTPSAEGPRTTESAQRFTARTYGAFRLTEHTCGWGVDDCRPGYPLILRFSNPIDGDAFDPETVRIDPRPADVVVSAGGDTISIQGSTAANTTYRVTVPADLQDTFGQRLGHDETVTFDVGEPHPSLWQFPRALTTVDPYAAAPSVSVASVGHDQLKVRLLSVTPADWPAYQRWRERDGDGDPAHLPGWPVAVTRTIDTGATSDGLPVETTIDLRDALDGPTGHVVVIVEPVTTPPRESDEYWSNRPAVTWAQVTSLGLDAFSDAKQVVAWVTDLRDGTPVSGATVQVGAATGTTDRDGLATTALQSADHLVVSKDGQEALLDSWWNGSWTRHRIDDQLRWYLVDDRGLYRPGETLHLKGVIRRIRLADGAAVVGIGGTPTLHFEATDGLGVSLAEGTAAVSALGTFDLALDIPEGANLGTAEIALTLTGVPQPTDGLTAWHTFRIDEFRRPTFEVAAREESPGPHLVSAPATVAVDADYFAGGPLVAAPVSWTVGHRDTTYAPPNWPDFTFGEWVPWWLWSGGWDLGSPSRIGAFEDDIFCCGPVPGSQEEIERFEGSTDAGGAHYLRIDLQGERPDQPVLVTANAAVTDVDRQQLADTVNLVVHPARYYVGLRTARTFVREGEQIDLDLVVTTIDGEAVAGRAVSVTAVRTEERYANGEYVEDELDEQTCDVTSAAEPVSCSFRADVGGRYRITAVVSDDEGGHQRSELTRWVSGARAIPNRTVQQEQLTIIPDEQTYEIGDTAHLLVAAPFDEGHGLATVTRGDIVSTQVFELADGSAVVDIPVTNALLGGAQVNVTVDGSAERLRDDGTADPDLPARPAYADGLITLAVPPLTKTLTVSAEPRDPAVEPGGRTTLDVVVTGPDGRGAADAEVAVIVADEAVLSLIGRELSNPVDRFHAMLGSNLRVDLVRGTVVLSLKDLAADGMGGDGASAGGLAFTSDTMATDSVAAPMPMDAGAARAVAEGVTGATPIVPRSNFDPLALFSPAVTTGDDGRATVEVTVPDNLTRYRIMAVAVQGEDRFGLGEAALTARLPLMVRPSAPRFLNFGDTFTFPLVLQNQTDGDLEVDVVLQGANLGVVGAGANAGGQRVRVPANDRVEVHFAASADVAGTARFRVAAVSGDLADAALGDLPVYTPVTTEAFATYGVLDGTPGTGAAGSVSAHRLLAPEGVVPQFGGLEVSTSSTSLATLTDAVLYLREYPYDSADAHASRVLAIASLRDVLEAFGADGLGSRAEVDAVAQDDLDALASLQRSDGGFRWWPSDGHDHPYLTAHVTHALLAGRAAGYHVDQGVLDRALGYLRNIERHLNEWNTWNRHVVLAYALHVRDLAGDRDAARAERLFREDPDLALDGLAWIWPVVDDASVADEIDRIVHNRVTETAGAATFVTGYDEDAYLVLASDARTDGLVLDALIRLEPTSDLIPKVVKGLIGNQRRGHWRNVQENAFVLLALKRYYDTYEATTPDLVARVWLGDDYVAQHPYRGRSVDGQRSVVPMSELVDGGDRDLVVQDDGVGRLYYRLGLSYAPDDLTLDPRDEGFVVDRVYEPIDEEDDVRREADGWHIRAGANVRVRLTMVADSARTNMALVDHLPAGLEAVNPAFATAPTILPEEPADGPVLARTSWWWGRWFDHQNLRDDRAEAFASYLWAGTYDYTYVARATTSGTFVAPPAKAEELYAPEVFGRSGSDRVIID